MIKNIGEYSYSYSNEDLLFFHKIPKKELHVHLDGSISYETLKKIGYKGNDLYGQKYDSLLDYLKVFGVINPYLQTKENLYIVAYDLVKDFLNDNVFYAEVRFNPDLHIKEGLSYEEIINTIISGFEDSKNGTNFNYKLILGTDRGNSTEYSYNTFKEYIRIINKNGWENKIAGFDINCGEIGNSPKKHEKSFELIKKNGFNLIIHAGEVIGDDIQDKTQYIKEAIDLGAKRIGHGVLAIKDNNTLKRLKEKNINIEICVSSNFQTEAFIDIKNHPIKEYIEKGLNLSINTDNRGVGNTTLTEELLLLNKLLGIDKNILKNIVKI